jgi:hypothetical protein
MIVSCAWQHAVINYLLPTWMQVADDSSTHGRGFSRYNGGASSDFSQRVVDGTGSPEQLVRAPGASPCREPTPCPTGEARDMEPQGPGVRACAELQGI